MKIVLGYPRSGNHWLVYCMKYAINQSLWFSHGNNLKFWDNCKNKNYSSIVFILRNYKECVVRHCETNIDIIKKELSGDGPTEKIKSKSDYLAILKLFDSYDKDKKILVYYEDLISNPENELNRLADYFNVDKNNVQTFMNNFNEHKNNSLKWCGNETQKPETNGNNIIHHSNKLTKEQRIELDELVMKNNKELFEKYLTRYSE